MPPAENDEPEEYAAGVAPPKNTGGGGFVFENDVCAWLLACMLVGEPPFDPALGAPVRLDFQTRPDGWFLDDVLVTAAVGPTRHRFALSIKSNAQFTASTAPADLVGCAWEQWLHVGSDRFERETDFMGIVTAPLSGAARASITGLLEKARSADPELVPARLATERWANEDERRLFLSFACPAPLAQANNIREADTVRLLQRVRCRQHDFSEDGSESLSAAMRMCRQALRDATENDAENLWNALRGLADDLRPLAGGLNRLDLVNRLRERFALAEYPDYRPDWAKLDAQSSVAATQVPNAIAGRVYLRREADLAALHEALGNDDFIALVGASGGGKSAIARAFFEVRSTDGQRTLWFDGRSFEQPDFNAFEASLRLRYSLSELLAAATDVKPTLILDGLDRIYSDTSFRNVSMLLRLARQASPSAQWRVVAPCQTQEWPRVLEGMQRAGFAGESWKEVEIKRPSTKDLSVVSAEIPALGKLFLQPRFSRLLGNLKMLDLIARRVATGANVDATAWVGESNVADWFWTAEVDRGSDRVVRGSFVRRLAQLQADQQLAAVRVDDFSIGELAPLDSLSTDRICLQVSGDRLAFGHDLFGDWARLRVLLGHREDLVDFLRTRVGSPLWHRAVRLFGIHLLEHESGVDEWRKIVASFAAEGIDGIRDLLLEAPIFAVNARLLLEAILTDLLARNGELLRRLLTRFLAFATVPNQQTLAIAKAMGFDGNIARATSRLPYWPYWVDVLGFLHAHGTDVVAVASYQVAHVVEMWLSYAPKRAVMRDEAAELAVLLGHRALESRELCGGSASQRERQRFYGCALAAAEERPDDVADIALRGSQRRADTADDADDAIPGSRRGQRRVTSTAAWPDGPRSDVDDGFQDAVLDGGSNILELFRVRPDVAREVILACLIAPPRDREWSYGTLSRREVEVNKRYRWHPALYIHGPFLGCLRSNFDEALELIARLVDFATLRWRDGEVSDNAQRRAEAIAQGHPEPEVDEALRANCPTDLTVGIGNEARIFAGNDRVYGWSGGLGTPPEAVVASLMALEQYFYLQIDEKKDVAAEVEQVVARAKSVAFLKVLCNVGKREPALFEGPLRPLLASHQIYRWDINTMIQGRSHFMIGAIDKGEWFVTLARQFHDLEHRRIDLRELAVRMMIYRQSVREYLVEAVADWKSIRSSNPGNRFPMLDQLILSLNPANYQSQEHPEHGTVLINVEAVRAHDEQADERRALEEQMLVTSFPMRCRQILEGNDKCSTDDLATLWQQWLRIRELAGQGPALPDGSERFGDEYANAIAGGITVFLDHADWCSDPARAAELTSSLQGVLDAPPPRNGFDTPESITTWSWDCFLAEALAILWVRDPASAELKHRVARMILAPHYTAVTLLFSRCANNREIIGADFEGLRRLALEAAYVRDRAELLARVPPEGLGLEVVAIARLRSALTEWWEERVSAFVSGSTDSIPANWAECDARDRFSELDAFRARWGKSRALDFHLVRCAHAWLPLPDRALNERERGDWIQFWRSALTITLARPLALREGQSNRFPGEDERWVLSAVAAVVLQMRTDESSDTLWQPILDLCGDFDDWPEIFVQAVHRIALTAEQLPATYVETVRVIAGYAFTDFKGARRWRSFEGVWDAVVGFDGYSCSYWEPRHAETVARLSDVFDDWMTKVPKTARRLAYFANWLGRPAASSVRPRSLSWFLGQLSVDGRELRDVDEAADAIAGLLNVVWWEDEQRLRRDRPAFEAFRGLLGWLADRQNAHGLELLGRIGSLA